MEQPPTTKPEQFILELASLPDQSKRDLTANAILQRIPEKELLARLIAKKLGGLFTVRAA